MSKIYKAVELVVKNTSITIEDKGSTNAARDDRMKRYITSEVERECLAAHIGWLDSSTFVSIPHTGVDGKAIDVDSYQQLLVGAQGSGVLVATQSGEKAGNYIRLTAEAWERFAAPLRGKVRGAKALQVAGLLFSATTKDQYSVESAVVITPGHPLDRGQDGNGMAPKSLTPTTVQVRFAALDAAGEVDASRVGKGILSPTSPDGRVYLHHSQLKGAWDIAPWEEGQEEIVVSVLVLRNEGVSAERIMRDPETGKVSLRAKRSWMSSEVTALFSPSANLHLAEGGEGIHSQKVRREVENLTGMFSEEGRVSLLKRWGGLELDEEGHLLPSKNAGIEALRTPLPWCREVEELLGRFAVPEVVQIAHGAGIPVKVSLLVQDEKYGRKPISLKAALKRVAEGKRVWGLYRVPVTGTQAIQWFTRAPYKRGIGFVIAPSAAKGMDGDSDGDPGYQIDPKDAPAVAQSLDTRLSGSGKPAKQAKPDFPLNSMSVLEYWMDMLVHHPLVGRATTLSWRLMRDGRHEDAVLASTAANAAPMLAKHRVDIDGEAVSDIVYRLSEEERARAPKTGDGYSIIAPLQWRDWKAASKPLRSLRQMAWGNGSPESVLDELSIVATRAVEAWAAKPVGELTFSRTARLVFARRGRLLPGWAVRSAARIRAEWANFWIAHIRREGDKVSFIGNDFDTIYNAVREWGAAADVESLAALMSHRRKSGESMRLKWAAIFDTHRGVEVLGLHPAVEEALGADYKRAKLVDALVASLEEE